MVDELGLPAEYRGRRGNITTARTLPQLKKFLEDGGTILTIGSSTALATQLGLPVENHLVAKDADGKEKPLGRDKFYVPPSILRAKVDIETSARVGLAGRGRRDVRQQPDVPTSGGCREGGLHRASRGSRARRRFAAAGRSGRNISTAASRSSTRKSGRGGWCCTVRRCSSGPAARHVQARLQRDLAGIRETVSVPQWCLPMREPNFLRRCPP